MSDVGVGLANGPEQAVDVLGAEVGHLLVLHVLPLPLHRVELGRVGRQPLQPKPPMPGRERLGGLAVRPQAIPDEDHRPSQVAQEVAHEDGHGLGVDGVAPQVQVAPQALSHRRDADGPDGRDAAAVVDMLDHRRLAHRSPGAPHRGRQREARLVDEDDPGPPEAGVFFILGQSLRSQCSMSAWLRWRALLWGFWGVQPSARMSRPMWSS